MKFFIRLQLLTIILILSSTLFAQKKAEVEVSPNINTQTILKKCKTLELGKVLVSQKPVYPEEARSARISGKVEIQVKVDEKGNVSEILNVKGNELLKESAKNAALQSKFTPTICDGQAAQIDAVITYNYIPFVITDEYFVPEKIEDFADVKNEINYYESILFITENYNLAFGYGDKKFHPDAPLTKGDFAHFLRLTLDMLQKRSELANKLPHDIGLFYSYNPQKIKSIDEIKDINEKLPYSTSIDLLLKNYGIGIVDDNLKFNGKFPLTQNEVIEYWTKIFGQDTVPINFARITNGDKILTRGEFALFLQESLYVLTYKVLP